MGRLFGTDGVRGVAYEFLTYELAEKIGRALGYILGEQKNKERRVVIGKDTRESGNMLTDAISCGLRAMGCVPYICGTISTPGIAYLTRTCGFDAGVMITASHNPYEYNGIKIFGSDGFKLTDDEEDRIEALLDSSKIMKDRKIRIEPILCPELCSKYADYLISSGTSLEGMKIAIDCANGAATETAQRVFEALGASCEFIGTEPDGKNINLGCGSTSLDKLKSKVISGGFDMGIAFDGDADRCLAIDENGIEVDGDFIIAILALDMKKSGKLSRNAVVGTVMANCGFGKFCEENGIDFVATKVGDRYVLEEMEKNSYNLGGEQSGHVIIRDFSTTGDGQLTAIRLLSVIKSSALPLSALASVMKKYPQKMINISATPSQKAALAADENIKGIIADAELLLRGRGRLLLRPSGTEPLVRVMVECEDEEATLQICKRVADGISEILKAY